MQILSKHLAFVLLSISIKAHALPLPFFPVYTNGDALTLAQPKPEVIYEELENSKTVVLDMPAYKTQDDLGDCRAFSLATIMQKYTCDKLKMEIADCKKPPSNRAISSFGMMIYTNVNANTEKTFQHDENANWQSVYKIATNLKGGGARFVLDSCEQPFDQVVNNFKDATKKNEFFKYVNNLYNSKKAKTEADIADCPECLAEIENRSGLSVDIANLKKALMAETYDKFLYSLFFSKCKLVPFPGAFTVKAYPEDSLNVTPKDIKKRIIEGLKLSKPVLFPSLCLEKISNGECVPGKGHSLVISGYKQACNLKDKVICKTACESGDTGICKDIFKVHNSWGEDWQKRNNDGWVDADSLTENTERTKSNNQYRIVSGSVIWLE